MPEKNNELNKQEKLFHVGDFLPFENLLSEEEEAWNATIVFHERDDNGNNFQPIININSWNELNANQELFHDKKIIDHKLFQIANEWDEEYMHYHRNYIRLAHLFFKDLFKLPDITKNPAEFYNTRIIIRKDKFEKIKQLITKNHLSKFHDFIFYIIAQIQKVYINDIESNERPRTIGEINNSVKEIKQLITIIENYSEEFDKEKLNRQSITFYLSNVKNIKIKHPDVVNYILLAIKEFTNGGTYKNWRKEIEKVAIIYSNEINKKHFRLHVNVALHHLFYSLNLFPIKEGKATSDAAMLCIANILDFAIEDTETTDRDKIKRIRIDIERNINEVAFNHEYENQQPNFGLLGMYFDSQFLFSVSTFKKSEVRERAYYICNRFGLISFLHEISHIVTCIRQKIYQLGLQLSRGDQPVLKNLQKLMFSLEENESGEHTISKFQFGLHGQSEVFTLDDPFELRLISHALKEYYINNQEEFETDIVASSIDQDPHSTHYNIKMSNTYQQPDKRFLPTICSSLYKFLEEEASSETIGELSHHDRLQIISVILIHSHVFTSETVSEDIVQMKVIKWLRLL